MAKYKCKMCGAPLDVVEGQTTITCSFCQSKQTVANPNDERKENLFNRANHLRSICDFDKAILSYQSIIAIFPTEAEAYWGLCLSKYGIEYVDDPITHKKIPTIHRVSYDSILKDSDYLMALSYADVIAKEEYQLEAKEIAEIQLNILAISQKEEPFDIFICYKETDENGKRTPDSVLSQEIYNTLTDKGYKVFFSRITLESKLGSMYEPYIFAALNSAKIMLVVGTKKEYFEAIWVKNEWSRFIDLMKIRPDHYLIPCYKNIDAYEMPEQFLAFQGQDMSKLGFMQDLIRGIDKIMGRNDNIKIKQETTVLQSDVNISALLKRAEILISDNDFTKADALIERVLDNDPTNSQAYLLKLLIELQLHSIEELKTLDNTIETNGNFKKAYKFGDSKQQAKLNEINELIKENIEKEKKELIYQSCLLDTKITTNDKFQRVQEVCQTLSTIIDYKDSKELMVKYEQALKSYEKRMKKNIKISIIFLATFALIFMILLLIPFIIPTIRQNKIITLIENHNYIAAQELLSKNGSFKNSEKLIQLCQAGEAFEVSDYESGINHITQIGGTVEIFDAVTNQEISFEKDGYNVTSKYLSHYSIDAKNYHIVIYLKPIEYMKPYETNGSKYIYFGEYPQTLKDDSITITSDTPDSDGYYLGSDGARYAKVEATPYSSAYYFNNNQQIVRGKTYYFKVEPIKWKILQVNGKEYKLVTDLIIDNQKFYSSIDYRTIDGKTIYSNNYEYSDIRKWLNKDFYNKAFTKELQSIINTTLVDNSAASTKSIYNAYICNDTYDKVYLLSYTDITNEEYGFTNDASREKQLSDYAKAKGSYMSTSTDYYNNGLYWLRSPDYYNDYRARSVDLDGYIPDSRISDVIIGVSAAITISLE